MTTVTKILTAVLLVISVGMFAYLYGSVNDVIEERNRITTQETAVTERLRLIREAEIVFLSVYGRYTANWDSLSNFINTGRVPIIQRREEIIQKAYGGEDVTIHIDTLGFVSAREKIFKKNFTVNAADDGTLVEFKVKLGDNVVRNQKAFAIKVLDQVKEQPFLEEGVIESFGAAPGEAVKKGQILISYWRNVFDTNVDISRIGNKPNSEDMFEIFVGKVDKAGVMVQVIEVKDPKPDNPIRKESNDQKARKPLRFGSRVDVSTAGNWE